MNEEKDSVAELLRLAGPRPRVPEDIKARVLANVRDEWHDEVSRRRRRTRIFGASGLAAAAALVIGFFLLRPVPQNGTTIETAGETRTIDWGGASLRLDRQTRVRLESDRVAELEKGAIYISTDGVGGLEIHTAFGTIRDVGTQFEVRLGEDHVRVRVREGRVDVRGTMVDAGTELIAGDTTVEKRAIAVSGGEWTWIERAAPPLVLEGMTVEDFIHRVGREKGLQVQWINSSVKSKRLHGRVPLSIDEALDAGAAAAGITWTIENGTLVVR